MTDEKREAERSDLYAVKDAADGTCTCPVQVTAIKSEMTLKQYKRLACAACQASACLGWLMEIADGV